MDEQFTIVKYGASFLVNYHSKRLQITPLEKGDLSASVYELIAASQLSIAKFYLITYRNRDKPFNSLKEFFSKKGWKVQEANKCS